MIELRRPMNRCKIPDSGDDLMRRAFQRRSGQIDPRHPHVIRVFKVVIRNRPVLERLQKLIVR